MVLETFDILSVVTFILLVGFHLDESKVLSVIGYYISASVATRSAKCCISFVSEFLNYAVLALAASLVVLVGHVLPTF